MSHSIDRIGSFFSSWTSRHGTAGAIGEIAAWLSSGELDPARFADLMAKHGVRRDEWFRKGVLDLVLEYAKERLGQDLLTIDDVMDIRVLNHALHVSEGEFVAHCPAEISALLQDALERILADDRLDGTEELHLVAVQAAFDLSYDDFLRLARPSFERAMADLDRRLVRAENEDPKAAASLTKARANLAAMHLLAEQQYRSLGALF